MGKKTNRLKVSTIGNVLYVRVSLYCVVTQEKEGLYCGYCPALDVASQGDDEHEAQRNIEEAVNFFIESCLEEGTLGEVLKEADFKVDKKVSAKKETSKEVSCITIPAFFPVAACPQSISQNIFC